MDACYTARNCYTAIIVLFFSKPGKYYRSNFKHPVMEPISGLHHLCFFTLLIASMQACQTSNQPNSAALNDIYLKRGELVLCGLPGNQFGVVDFNKSCPDKVKKDFNLALALLHFFEYDKLKKVPQKL